MNKHQIDKINDQHQELANALTELLQYEGKSVSAEIPLAMFAAFVVLLEAHMDYEEAVMNELDYFDIEDHHCVHRTFLNLVKRTYDGATQDHASIFFGARLVDRTLSDHVEIEDKLFRIHLGLSELLDILN